MSFVNVANIADAEVTTGAYRYSSWRKAPTQTTSQGYWFDLSLSPGNPPPQYYASAPLISVAMSQSADFGIYHPPPVSPSICYLRKMLVMSINAAVVPMPMILLDYLLYYPFIDESTTGTQSLTTSATLPRYISGQGVQMMAVVAEGQTGGTTFNVSYTNQAGVSGQTSQTVTLNTQTAIGTIVTTAPASAGCYGPFIPLQSGDTGVQSVQSVNMISPDTGLFTLVLVKPLAALSIRGIDAPVELDYFIHQGGELPIIVDDAYLNFICNPGGSLSGTQIMGIAEFAWG